MRIILAIIVLLLTSVAYAQIAGYGGGNSPVGPTFRKSIDESGFGIAGGGGGSGGGGGGGNCIEYQTSGCILYTYGSSNSILVQ